MACLHPLLKGPALLSPAQHGNAPSWLWFGSSDLALEGIGGHGFLLCSPLPINPFWPQKIWFVVWRGCSDEQAELAILPFPSVSFICPRGRWLHPCLLQQWPMQLLVQQGTHSPKDQPSWCQQGGMADSHSFAGFVQAQGIFLWSCQSKWEVFCLAAGS